jgi:hypothetical protein
MRLLAEAFMRFFVRLLKDFIDYVLGELLD